MTEPLNRIRAKLSGLHFAQEALSEHERETLHLAEDLLRRIDTVLEIAARAKREVGEPGMWLMAARIEKVMDGDEIEFKGSRTHEGVTGTVYGPAGKEFPWRDERLSGPAEFMEPEEVAMERTIARVVEASRLRRAGRDEQPDGGR